MQKRVWAFVFCFSCIAAMNAPVAQTDDVQQVVMGAYHAIVFPHIEQLTLLRMQLERNLFAGNIHGILCALLAIRRSGFRLVREYRRFDRQMQHNGIEQLSCATARQLLTRFILSYAPLISDQLNDFFSTLTLSDIFVAEQIDWTEPFFILENLLEGHEHIEIPVIMPAATAVQNIVENEPCGIDLIEFPEQHESTAIRRCLCYWCLFR